MNRCQLDKTIYTDKILIGNHRGLGANMAVWQQDNYYSDRVCGGMPPITISNALQSVTNCHRSHIYEKRHYQMWHAKCLGGHYAEVKCFTDKHGYSMGYH